MIMVSDYPKIDPCLLVIMGVSGCGKTTLAMKLSQILDWPFQEGDDLHPHENVQKMAAGIALTDKDRWPWLEKCHDWLASCKVEHNHKGGILTCSALKRSYRDLLQKKITAPLYFLYLQIPEFVLEKRLNERNDHYMPASLLSSQLRTLEPPTSDESFLTIGLKQPVSEILQRIAERQKDNSLFSR